MKNPVFAAAAALALILAGVMTWRVSSERSGFERKVRESLETSEGYDQKFIDLVNRLEEVLAVRASFSYPGGKDPMTGKMRLVVQPPPRVRRSPADTSATEEVDPIRLTAIIADDNGRHTAIVRNGERSLSVGVGDVVGGRRILRITHAEIAMEADTLLYVYPISGGRTVLRKGRKESEP